MCTNLNLPGRIIMVKERGTNTMTLEQMYDYLIEYGVATEDEINLVTNINGYSIYTMLDILYARTGLHSFDQLIEEN